VGDKGVDEVKNLLDPSTEGEIADFAGQLVDDALAKDNARKAFREELINLVAKISADQKPIFIFVDELDRCNPRFAVDLLERIKHLFDVDGIKFIVSVDSTQLAHSIRGTYGQDFDATTYLQRFFDQTFSLPYPTPYEFAKLLFKDIDFDVYDKEIRMWHRHEPAKEFAELSECFNLTLRQQQQAFERMKAIIPNIQGTPVHLNYLMGLIMFRLKHSGKYREYANSADRTAFWRELRSRFHMKAGRSVELFTKYIEWTSKTHAQLQKELNAAEPDSFPSRRNEQERFHAFCREIAGDIFTSLDIRLYLQYVEMAMTLTRGDENE
jgi:hypothetical protein